MLKLKLGKKKGDAAPPAVIEGETAQDVEGGETGKKKPPLLLIIIGAAVLVAGVGGGAAFFLLKPKSAEPEAAAASEEHAPAEEGGHGAEGEGEAVDATGETGTVKPGPDGVTFYTLPDMIVNIQSPEGRTTYLKLKLTLEMEDKAAAASLQAQYPRLKDMFQSFLRELRPEDLAGSAGSFQLRSELLRRVNLIAAPAKVDAVLIEEMLVQ